MFLLEGPIAFHKWQRVLNVGIGIFVASTCLIPLGAFVCYVGSVGWGSSLDLIGASALEKGGDFRSENKGLSEAVITQLGGHVWVPMPKIQEKVLYLEHKNRPDCDVGEDQILLSLDGFDSERLVYPGEVIYLDCISEEEFSFADHETPFWLRPILLDDGRLEISYGARFLNARELPIFESTKLVCIKEPQTQSRGSVGKGGFASVVKSILDSKVYPSDRLIDLYGGDSFVGVKGLFRIDFKGSKKGFFFVKEGDILTWEGSEFVPNPKDTAGKPLLLVKEIDGQGAHCTLWDSDGIVTESIVIPLVKTAPLQAKPSEIFSRIHFRSDSSVTCHMGNRDVILREGDWLLHTKAGWRNMHSSRELKDYLRYALKGELFIFDKIKKSDAGVFFTGRLFDENRTSYQAVEIPLKAKPVVKKQPLDKVGIKAGKRLNMKPKEEN